MNFQNTTVITTNCATEKQYNTEFESGYLYNLTRGNYMLKWDYS